MSEHSSEPAGDEFDPRLYGGTRPIVIHMTTAEFMGINIDTPSEDELAPATAKTPEEIAAKLGVTSVEYLPADEVRKIVNQGE